MRTTFVLTAALAAVFAIRLADAQPQVPATFYGSVSIDGEPVPDGTEVIAYVDGKDCTQRGPSYRGTITIDGVSAYSITVVHESQIPGCGAPGKTVTFTIGGRPAAQTAVWQFGPQEVDLSAGTGEPLRLPTPTPMPPAPSRSPQTPSVAATSTAPALPTDDAGPPPSVAGASGQRSPVASRSPETHAAEGSVSGGSAVWPWVLAGAAAVAAGASLAGWRLARRRR